MKKKIKDFSVIISVYDGIEVQLYKKSLLSILNQTYLPKEVILVLDGVKKKQLIDETIKFKNKFKRVKIINNSKNVGIAKSYNRAIKYLKTDLVAIQDSDDLSLSGRFKAQYDYLHQNKNISVIGTSVYEYDLDTGKKLKKLNPISFEEIKKNMRFRNPINHPTVMFRKGDVKKCGGYKNLNRMEDYHLWIRMISFGYLINNLKIPFVIMHVKKDFYQRRSGLQILKSELTIQLLLFKKKYNNFLMLLIITFAKCFYHLCPAFIKKIIRNNYFLNLLNK